MDGGWGYDLFNTRLNSYTKTEAQLSKGDKMNLDEKYQEQTAYDMGYNSGLNYEPLASLQDYALYVSNDKYYLNYKQGHEDGVKALKISSM